MGQDGPGGGPGGGGDPGPGVGPDGGWGPGPGGGWGPGPEGPWGQDFFPGPGGFFGPVGCFGGLADGLYLPCFLVCAAAGCYKTVLVDLVAHMALLVDSGEAHPLLIGYRSSDTFALPCLVLLDATFLLLIAVMLNAFHRFICFLLH